MRVFFIFIFLYAQIIGAQNNFIKEVENFQKELNKEFKDPNKSPLTSEDLKTFRTLEFFPIDTSYVVKAKFTKNPNPKPFLMKTTTDRLPIYIVYGTISFVLKGQKFTLNLYQNQQFVQTNYLEDYLFLPFTDKTNGKESYGGGRYIDLNIPEDDQIVINFNKAYNPYCAYSGRYSCPIPPKENRMDIAIPVGVKNYKH